MSDPTTPEQRAELRHAAESARIGEWAYQVGPDALLALLDERDALAARQARWGGPSGPIARLIAEVGCDCDAHTEDPPEDHTCTAGEAEAEWCALRERIAELEAREHALESAIADALPEVESGAATWLDGCVARIAELHALAAREPVVCPECQGRCYFLGRPCHACGGRGAVWQDRLR